MPATWYFELEKRNPLLAKAGVIGFLIAIGLVLVSFFDQRELLGVSVWNKPIKFFLSVSIYFWTMGWLMENLGQPKKSLQDKSFHISVANRRIGNYHISGHSWRAISL